MSTTTITVSGMTCNHCVDAVSEEIRALGGVEHVAVDLNSGGPSTVTIDSDQPLDLEAVGEAVAEAGYTMLDED